MFDVYTCPVVKVSFSSEASLVLLHVYQMNHVD